MLNTKSKTQEPIIISPSFQLPIIVLILSFMLLFLNIGSWPTIVSASFSFFLLLQSFTLRIKITNENFIVLQLGKELRCFPYDKWIAWRLFLPSLPGILYFREEASPHLLPILFDVNSLKEQLRLRVKDLEIKKEVDSSKSKN